MAFVACGAKILTSYALRLANQIFMRHTAKVLKQLRIFHVCSTNTQTYTYLNVCCTYERGRCAYAACKTYVKRAAKQMMLISCETTKKKEHAIL